MRRVILLLTAAAVMAAMLVVMAAPAMALGSEGIVRIDPLNRSLTVVPPNPIVEANTITNVVPPNPISPLVEHNPNVLAACDLDVCPTT